MTQKVPLQLVGGFYESPAVPLSAQNCINWIPIAAEVEGTLRPRALMTPPSLTQLGTVGASVNRGALPMAGTPYFVNGTSLYSMDAAGTATTIGTISGTGRVSMATNGTKLVIVVPGGTAYVYDGSTLATITDPDYRVSDTVVFKDGYFIFTASAGDVFFNSELNDPANIDPLDFGTAEIQGDKIVSAHVNHNELFILGEETIEIFQNVGGSGFPFQRIPGANIQKGCYAKFSAVEFDNTFLFIGGGLNEKAGVWRVASSQSATKISTDAIDAAIDNFTSTEIASAFANTFTVDGQFIATFTFESTTTDPVTFCYNGTSQRWFQLQTGILPGRWRVNSIINAHGKLLCGDSVDGRVGYLGEVYTEYGATIYRERTTAPFMLDGNSHYWPEVELLIESGVGLTSGQGSDPKIRMSYSDDGARTFSPEREKSFGKIGRYNQRAIWRRNGRVPFNRVVRFTETDPVKCNLLGMIGRVEKGYG